MTISDIIEYFEKTGALGPKGYGLAELQLRTAALLKAGQAMRENIEIYNSPLFSVQGARTKNATYGAPSLVTACTKWDELVNPLPGDEG